MSGINKKKPKKPIGLSEFYQKHNLKWVLIISLWTFFIAVAINVLSEIILSDSNTYIALIVLLIIILIGVIADIIGVAITTACTKPFHAMAADRVSGAKFAIKLLNNAGSVSNFCNDVIGDICGIISGIAGASIIINMKNISSSIPHGLLVTILSGLVASITVGGKAIGKTLAINNSHKIVFNTARFLNSIEEKTGINIIPSSKKKK